MMTTKKRCRSQLNRVVVAAVAMLVTACGPPGARELKQGEQYIQAGQSADAVSILKDAVRILSDAPHPVQAKAWNLLGVACQDSGRLDDAAKSYTMALKMDRDNAAIDYNMGCLRSQQTNFPGAIDYLTTYVTLRPKDVQGYLRLGSARFHSALEHTGAERSRLMDAARRDFEKADALAVSADAANSLGMYEWLRWQLSAETAHAAAKEFALALQRDPHYAPAILNLAIVSQAYLNQPVQALAYYRQYLAINPPPPHVKEVTKLAHDLDLNQRIIIGPETAPAHAVNRPATPTTVPAPPPTKVAVIPSNPPVNTPKPPPSDSPQAQTVVPAPTPVVTPAPPPSPSPTQARVAATPSTQQAPPEAASPVNSTEPAPEPVVTGNAPPPKKTITQRLNPLNWFSGKQKGADSGGKLAPEPPPVAPGTRFEYPPPVTPIPGDRAQAKRFEAEAIRARQAGDVAESIRAYKDAVAADPTFYDANYGLGLAALNAREYPIALESLHRALALQEDSAEARYAFAWALQKRGYNEDAVHELGKLLARHPNEVRAHLLLGNLYAEKLNQPRLAREQFTLTLEMDPKNAQAESIRAWMKLNP
jgi:tetratricopeptide (TPR) repeat protein